MTPHEEPDVIPAEEAKKLLKTAIAEHLGDNWNDADKGWRVVTNHDYMARLNKGRVNIDFYVNYFDGSVTIERSGVNAGQEAGGITAVILLVLVVLFALVAARVLGVL